MAVVQYLRNTKFNNRALPKIWPFSLGSYIADGLVFALQPQHNLDSLIDLSGNGTIFNPVGSPEFTDVGCICRANNYFQTSRLETKAATAMVLSRVVGAGGAALVTGLSALGVSSYRQDTSVTGLEYAVGMSSAYSSIEAGTLGSGFIRPRWRNQSIVEGVSTSTANVMNSIYGQDQPDTATSTPWIVCITVIDPDAEVLNSYARNGNINSYTTFSPTTHPDMIKSISGRPLTQFQTWNVGASLGWTSQQRVEIMAAAVWNRALSKAECDKQYQMMAQLALDRGITLL